MKHLYLVSFLAFGFGSIAARAQDSASSTCTQGKLTRTVSVTYDSPATKAPCKVNYVKEAGAAAKVIFSAEKQVGFCEKKAADFVEKLKSSGWTCN